jgi:hypothetical protein
VLGISFGDRSELNIPFLNDCDDDDEEIWLVIGIEIMYVPYIIRCPNGCKFKLGTEVCITVYIVQVRGDISIIIFRVHQQKSLFCT